MQLVAVLISVDEVSIARLFQTALRARKHTPRRALCQAAAPGLTGGNLTGEVAHPEPIRGLWLEDLASAAAPQKQPLELSISSRLHRLQRGPQPGLDSLGNIWKGRMNERKTLQ